MLTQDELIGANDRSILASAVILHRVRTATGQRQLATRTALAAIDDAKSTLEQLELIASASRALFVEQVNKPR